MTNVFVQIVILLYLMDNNEQTSWMIIASSGIGVIIEAWKVTAVLHSVNSPVLNTSRLPKQ